MAENLSRVGEKNTRWALKHDNTRIHISQVTIGGKKGYFCPSCKVEMQANVSNIISSYFSHDPNDRKNKGKCTFSDETYRHKIAKEVLQRLKYIKVPRVYKFPPLTQENAMANKLKDSEFVYAHRVENELTFYEDELGNIKYGRGEDVKTLIIKPDVTFFDENDKPILFVEIVAKNKVNTSKLHKLYCLGIDTIEVIIPSHFNEQQIEENFKNTDNTKWIYNHEREHSQYVFRSKPNTDELQSNHEFESSNAQQLETFECQTFRIRELVRRIRKFMGTGEFVSAARYFGEEIQRVEGNAETVGDALRARKTGVEESVRAEFTARIQEITIEKGRIKDERERVESDFGRRREGLAGKVEEQLKSGNELLEREIQRFRTEEAELEEQFQIEFQRSRENNSDYRTRAGLESKIKRSIEESNDLGDKNGRIEEALAIQGREIEGLEFEFETKGAELERKFDGLRKQSVKSIEERDGFGKSRVSTRIQGILREWKELTDLGHAQFENEKLIRAKRVFDEKSFRNRGV